MKVKDFKLIVATGTKVIVSALETPEKSYIYPALHPLEIPEEYNDYKISLFASDVEGVISIWIIP